MKRGQTNIRVTALLLGILIILTSIVILMNIFIPLIKEKTKLINIDIFLNTLEIKEATRTLSGDLKVEVTKSGNKNISQLKFLLYDYKGNIMNFTKDNIDLKELETKTYVIDSKYLNGIEVESITVVSINKNVEGIKSSLVKIKNSELGVTPNNNLVSDWMMQENEKWEVKPHTIIIEDPESNEASAYCSKETNPECNTKTLVISNLIPISSDKAYKFSVWIKSEDKNKWNALFATLYDSQKNLISQKANFKISKIDNTNWMKLEGYLGPSNVNDCNKPETNGDDYCNAPNAKYVKIGFGTCTNQDVNEEIKETCFMYPKIEEVDVNIFSGA